MKDNNADKSIAASLTNAFFLNALVKQQSGVKIDLMDKAMVTSITKEVNAVYLAFQEVVKGLDQKEK